MRDFNLFLANAVVVFVLASCVYRKHIRRFRLFLIAVGLFIGGLVMHDLAEMVQPRSSFTGPPVPAPPTFTFLRMLSRWSTYASLPLFILACFGSDVAYPQCSICGYNLTGNNSGVCPECGRSLSEKSQSA